MITDDLGGIAYWPIGIEGPQPEKLRLAGKDNYGKPRQDFADRLVAYNDREFTNVCEEYIWLSAWAANNRRSDYHWMAEACLHEAIRRGAPYLYDSAWHRASGM